MAGHYRALSHVLARSVATGRRALENIRPSLGVQGSFPLDETSSHIRFLMGDVMQRETEELKFKQEREEEKATSLDHVTNRVLFSMDRRRETDWMDCEIG